MAVPDHDDCRFTWHLNHDWNALVLPGSFLGRGADPPGAGRSGAGRSAAGFEATGKTNPGAGYVRVALVEDLQACIDGGRRICGLLAEATPDIPYTAKSSHPGVNP